MIQVQHLSKTFGCRAAIKDLSFEARDASITGLLGANGAGKTTTLRMVCGVLTPDSGTIRIDREAELVQGRRQRVGALLDHTGLYARLTVKENLMYFGRLRGLCPEVLEHNVERLIAILGLRSIADRRASGLSQGERMKVALGRAVVHSPRNLVLDEPTNGLDVPTVRSLREFLRELREAGTCIVFSSHVLEEVRVLCDNVIIVSHGAVVSQGSAAAICSRTNTTSLEDAFVQLTSVVESRIC
jgi:sodium transport system ATP-binding protein